MVKEHQATITHIRLLREDLMILRMVPDEGVPEYVTGQFLTLALPVVSEGYKVIRRAYSIASHPENRDYFEFVIRWVRKPLPGRVTTMLFYASEGDKIGFGMPTGNALTIDNELPTGAPDRRRIVCVGGGTGIAPFVAFAKHLRAVGDTREIVVLHGASYVDELSYKEEFTDLENQSKANPEWNFRYRAAISRPKEWFNRSWSGQTGRVESFFKSPGAGKPSPIDEMVGEQITPENTMIYICGYQGTIDGVIDYVKDRGFVTLHKKKPDGSYSIKYESYG